MKKTLLVTIDYPPAYGGVAAYWKKIAQSIAADKLCVLTDKDIPTSLQRACDENRPLLSKRFWPKWLRGVFSIHSAVRQTGCKQVLAGQLLPVGSMAWLYKRLTGTPYFVQVYGMDIEQARLSPRKSKLAQKVLKEAKGVIANSRAVAKLAREFCPSQKNVCIVYPIPESPAPPSREAAAEIENRYHLDDRPIILTLGRLVPRKGQDKVLAAMLHIWQEFPKALYVIAGDGPDRERLQKMAAPHIEKVIFTGALSEDERNAWLDRADIFAMVSRQMPGDIEGFGMVYLEANFMGLPVVAGNSGGVKEAVLDGKTGLLVSPEDTDEIAGALLRLLRNPNEAEQLARQGRERLERELTWNNELKTFKDFLS